MEDSFDTDVLAGQQREGLHDAPACLERGLSKARAKLEVTQVTMVVWNGSKQLPFVSRVV